MTLLGVAALGVAGCSLLNGPPSGEGSLPDNTSLPEQSATSVAPHSPGNSAAGRAQLLVLGGPAAGPYGLWTYSKEGGWSEVQASVEATAIGRSASTLVLGGLLGVESRPLDGYSVPQPRRAWVWNLAEPMKPIASIAQSQTGRIAFVAVDGPTASYLVENESGGLEPLSPQPRQAFSPLVAWLTGERVLAPSVDDRQIPRLAVIDPSSRQMNLLGGASGVRAFAVSPTGTAIAVATQDDIYVGETAAWLSGATPSPAVHVPDGKVVWHLALSPDATRVAMLSGEVGADGVVSAVREVAYERTASGWQRILEVELPFASVAGQVWLD